MIETLLILGAYLIGSIPTGVIVGRMRGFDPRAVGCGNIGTSNVARAGGASAAVMTLGWRRAQRRDSGDRRASPWLSGRRRSRGPRSPRFIGSIWSVFLGFRGGKGVACALGIWLAISPTVILIALAVFAVVFAISRIMSLASMGAAIALPPTVAILGPAASLLAARDPDDGAGAVPPSREYPAPVARRRAQVPAQAQRQRCVLASACQLIGRPPVKHPGG